MKFSRSYREIKSSADMSIYERIVGEILQYCNLRNRYLTNSDVEFFLDGAISEGEASDVISQVRQKLMILKNDLDDLNWGDEAPNISNHYNDTFEFCKETLTARAFNNLKEDIFDPLTRAVEINL